MRAPVSPLLLACAAVGAAPQPADREASDVHEEYVSRGAAVVVRPAARRARSDPVIESVASARSRHDRALGSVTIDMWTQPVSNLDAASGSAALVYANETDTSRGFLFFPPGQNVALGDDLVLAGSARELSAYSRICVWSPPGTPSFNVTIQLWSDSGAGAGPAAPIPGTTCLATGIPSGTEFPEDAVDYGDCVFGPDSGIVLPNSVWMVLRFSTNSAGWVLAQGAETGFTDDLAWVSPPGALVTHNNAFAGHCARVHAEPQATCGPGAGDCCVSNGTPGRQTVSCCNAVCFSDPFCCGVEGGLWDHICALEAALSCGGLCPPPTAGACCDDVSGVCRDAVEEKACIGEFYRYGGHGTFCSELDPPCPADLPCCLQGGTCFATGAGSCTTEFGGRIVSDCAEFRPLVLPPPDYLGGCPAGTTPLTTVAFGTGSVPAIPAGFFGPGSDPFEGLVELRGNPIDPETLGETSTVLQRSADPVAPQDPSGSMGIVDVEIVQMRLTSVRPITVTSGGGQMPQSWTMRVEPSATPAPRGSLQAAKHSDNAGTLDCTIFVQPKFVFESVAAPSAMRVFDTGVEGIPPIRLQSAGVPFVHNPLPDLDVVHDSASRFIPGIAEITLDEVTSQVPVPFVNASPEVTHTVCPPRRQKHCIYRVECLEGNCGNCPLARRNTCFEFTCFDTCPVGTTRTCGGEGCCVEYRLIDCRERGTEPPCPAGDPCECKPPADSWWTWTDGQRDRTYQDVELPADFFGTGSDPFHGRIEFEGVPIDPARMGDADTRVQRSADPVGAGDAPGSMGTVDVEIIGMQLVSVEPITVTYQKGRSPTEWKVKVTLSGTAAPIGSLTATKSHDNGGTFDSTLFVQPKLWFERVGPSCACGELDGVPGVDLADYEGFIQCFGQNGPTIGCDPGAFVCSDLDQNGVANLPDFALFQRLFGLEVTESPPDCLTDAPRPRLVVWDTAGVLAPIEFTSTDVPFVFEANPDLNMIVPSGAGFVPGVVETTPGDSSSQTPQPVIEEAQLARHTVCPPRRCIADLDIDSDDDNGTRNPDRSAKEDAIEENAPGKYICLNNDDDNGNERPDLVDEPPFEQENELVPMSLELTPNTPPGAWKLTYTNQVEVYDAAASPPTSIPSGTVFPVPMGPNPKRVLVEGVRRSGTLGDVTLTLEYGCGQDATSNADDRVKATVITLDLDVDSDNDGAAPIFAPERDAVEDRIEDAAGRPGRQLCANNDDDDNDGIIDFLDGYNGDGIPGNRDDANGNENDFVNLVFEIPAPVDVTLANVRVRMEGYGDYRIWTKPGGAPRKRIPISAAGDWVPADVYKATDLGLTNTNRVVQLWLEGLTASLTVGGTRLVFELDPDGDGPAGFVCGDAVRITICRILLLDRRLAYTDHLDIGHWGADSGANGLDGYDAGGAVINGAGGTFIDTDPDRFFIEVQCAVANVDDGAAETIQAKIATLDPMGAEDDLDDILDLLETGANTAVFRSESLLLMPPDVPVLDNPDDDFMAYSARAGGAVGDGAQNDRTHRAAVDGRVRARFRTGVLECETNLSVCDRDPEERKTLNVQVHVFNEPWQDVGYDHDGNPASPRVGVGNGRFDFTDNAPANGRHDPGEISEPFMDISGGATVFGNAGSWGPIWSDTEVERQLLFLRSYLAPACIRVNEVGAWQRPNPAGNLFRHTPGFFDDYPDDDGVTGTPSRDEAVIQANHRSAVNLDAGDGDDVLDMYFVAPFSGAANANLGSSLISGQIANGTIANALLVNQFHAGLNAATRVRLLDPEVAAHEAMHHLTNRVADFATPNYIFFPAFGSRPSDGLSWDDKRRMTHVPTEHDARTERPAGAGNTGAAGNRLLRSP